MHHPGLYRWSLLGNPLTRWLTRRRTRQLFDLMAGFVHSQVLLGCVRLDLFRALHQAPASLDRFGPPHRLGPGGFAAPCCSRPWRWAFWSTAAKAVLVWVHWVCRWRSTRALRK